MKTIVDYIRHLFPNASDDRLLTVAVTLGIFFAGFIIRGVINYFSSEIKKKQVRNDVRSIILEITENLTSQIEHIKSFTSRITVDSNMWIMTYVNIPIDRLDEYGYKEVSNAFITSRHFWRSEKARSSINQVFKHIDLIRNVTGDYRSFFEKMNDKYQRHNKEFDELNKLQGKLLDDIASELNSNERTRGLIEPEKLVATDIQKAMDVRAEWFLAEDNHLPTILNEELISRTFDLFKGRRLEHPILRRAVASLRDSKQEFNSMLQITNHLLEGLDSYGSSYSQAYSALSKAYIYKTKY